MISVIIPAHNEEKYILKTINSVKNQTYKDYEIILVDDKSEDKTASLVKNEVDYLIQLNKKSGPAKARNEGVKRAEGDYLVFLDADTLLTPKVLEEINNKKKNFIVGTCKIQPSNDALKHKIVMDLKNWLLCPFGVSNGIFFCSKDTFNKYGPLNEEVKKREEGMFIRTAKKNGKFKVLNEPVISSTRRFEHKGYMNIAYYWVKEALKPTDEEYEVIR